MCRRRRRRRLNYRLAHEYASDKFRNAPLCQKLHSFARRRLVWLPQAPVARRVCLFKRCTSILLTCLQTTSRTYTHTHKHKSNTFPAPSSIQTWRWMSLQNVNCNAEFCCCCGWLSWEVLVLPNSTQSTCKLVALQVKKERFSSLLISAKLQQSGAVNKYLSCLLYFALFAARHLIQVVDVDQVVSWARVDARWT